MVEDEDEDEFADEQGEVMLWWSVESGMLFATTTNSVVGPTGLSTALPGMNQVE